MFVPVPTKTSKKASKNGCIKVILATFCAPLAYNYGRFGYGYFS
jgi:hypothetical protein